MPLELELSQTSTVPLEVEGITPDNLRGLGLAQIQQMEIFQGNRKARLSDFFHVSGDLNDDQTMIWRGELAGVHWIGAKMASGKMTIHGNAGRHVGSDMCGGSIVVEGNAGDWVGGELHGGLIHIRGNAGHLVGAAYRGSVRGMTGGTILVDGDVGNELGHSMRRGLIAVGGKAGDLIGFNMLAGTIIVLGTVGIRHGAGMRRGTLALCAGERNEMLPTFRYACRYRPPILPLLVRELAAQNFPISAQLGATEFDLYHGDMLDGGRGEILVPVPTP